MSKIISYKKAPLVEVVIGLQLKEEIIPNEYLFGTFYEKNKINFPNIQEHPPLHSIIERIDGQSEIILPNGFSTRKYFIEKAENKLIQIQKNRILFNWRANDNGQQYPHYENVLKEYISIVNSLDSDLKILKNVNQLEFTYVDHIEVEFLLNEGLNLSNVFSFINLENDIKTINCVFNIWNENINGNVIVSLKTGKRNKDQKKILILETTCRGYRTDLPSISEWYNIAHKILLEYFEKLSTEKIKALWVKEM